jgi:hypothetical protein
MVVKIDEEISGLMFWPVEFHPHVTSKVHMCLEQNSQRLEPTSQKSQTLLQFVEMILHGRCLPKFSEGNLN